VSRTYPENSDESNTLLMAWDMLHGNVLLHGWYLSDVSFYTTELPQYVMLERFIGLHTDTAHVGAAMTYTLVVVLAALLARGRTSGREAWPRMLLTTGIMFAPQLGVAVFVLLLSVGHIGTAVPLMLTWLVLDRFDGPRRRWWVPVLVGLLLTWVLIADPLVLVVGIVPLVAVCALRAVRGVTAEQGRAGPGGRPAGWLPGLAAQWYELSIAVAAILAEGLASGVNRLLRAGGGFILHPVGYQLAPVHTWPKHAWVTAEGLLALFGAKPQGPAVELAFALLHLAGVGLVLWAMYRVVRHFVSWPDMISQVLLVAMVVNVVVYVPSTLANATDLNAREFAVVLPFGAVLAGRTLTAGLRAREARPRKWLAPVVLAVLAGYAASLGYAAAQPTPSCGSSWPRTISPAASAGTGSRASSPSAATAPSSSGRWGRYTCSPTCGSPRAPGTTPGRTGPRSWSPTARPASSTTGSPIPRRSPPSAGRSAPTTSVPTPSSSGTRTCWFSSGARDGSAS
jgi:hypothetical protein